jgi:hypothetical protein
MSFFKLVVGNRGGREKKTKRNNDNGFSLISLISPTAAASPVGGPRQ